MPSASREASPTVARADAVAPSAGRNGAAGSFQLSAAGKGRFLAQGPLTFATARSAREQGLRALGGAAERELEVDCSGVSASDSAGLAVLLDWLGAVRRGGAHSLRYSHLPEDLIALGRISEVEAMLLGGVQAGSS
jgi:phospholipid transport system transporter-binding protein